MCIYVRAPQLPLREAGFACRKIRLGIATFGSTSGFHPNPNPLSTSQPPPFPQVVFGSYASSLVPLLQVGVFVVVFFHPKKKETGRGAWFCQWWGQDMNLSLTCFYYLSIYIYNIDTNHIEWDRCDWKIAHPQQSSRYPKSSEWLKWMLWGPLGGIWTSFLFDGISPAVNHVWVENDCGPGIVSFPFFWIMVTTL